MGYTAEGAYSAFGSGRVKERSHTTAAGGAPLAPFGRVAVGGLRIIYGYLCILFIY